MENLYDYFLHYNIYTEEWNAILRGKTNKYMNENAANLSETFITEEEVIYEE